MEKDRKKKKSRKKQIGVHTVWYEYLKMLGSIGRSEDPKKGSSKWLRVGVCSRFMPHPRPSYSFSDGSGVYRCSERMQKWGVSIICDSYAAFRVRKHRQRLWMVQATKGWSALDLVVFRNNCGSDCMYLIHLVCGCKMFPNQTHWPLISEFPLVHPICIHSISQSWQYEIFQKCFRNCPEKLGTFIIYNFESRKKNISMTDSYDSYHRTHITLLSASNIIN